MFIIKVKKVLYDISVTLTVISENLDNKINNIRFEKSQELAAIGEFPLDPYEFDFLLLCNKVCGASHYNMQMKIVVETQDEFEDWFNEQITFKEFIK